MLGLGRGILYALLSAILVRALQASQNQVIYMWALYLMLPEIQQAEMLFSRGRRREDEKTCRVEWILQEEE